MFGQAIVQSCVIHLFRNTFRYASKKYWGQIATDLKPIYGAPTRDAAWRAFEEFDEKWGKPYPAISGLWRTAWEQFTPFLDYDTEIRKVPVLDQRDRVLERPLLPRGHGAGPLPHRAGRDDVPLHGHQVTGPQGHRSDTMDDEVEASTQRLRHHLRRPHASRGEPLTMETLLTPLLGQTRT